MQVDIPVSHLGFYAGLNVIWAATRQGDAAEKELGEVADAMGQAWYADTADWSDALFQPVDTMLSTMSEGTAVPHDATLMRETFLGLADYIHDTSEWLQTNADAFKKFKDGLFQSIQAIKLVSGPLPEFLKIDDIPELTEEQNAFVTLFKETQSQ